jgi:hypothetical protein
MRAAMYRSCLIGWLAITLGGYAAAAPAEDLVGEAMGSFPPKTIRLEYSSPAQLRQLANYQSLRQRFVGPRLQALESSLSEIGIKEDDINELVMGWEAGSSDMALYGFASGQFDPQAMAARAAARGLSPSPVAGQQAYCLGKGSASTCVVALGTSLGVFGPLPMLAATLKARSGKAPGLNSDERFTRLLDSVERDAPIWGMAVGPAVGDWFKGWMPNQGDIKLDWGHVFADVDSLVYGVRAGDKADVNMLLNCRTSDTAAGLRQVLEGLKMAQQLVWQTQNPNRSNPFEGMNISLSGQQVSIQLSADFSQLEIANEGGSAPN